jgi:general secretion pathway protein G
MSATMRRPTSRKRTGQTSVRTAFTLIEVLLVLIILVIIGSLAVNVFTGTQKTASVNAAKSNVSLVRGAIDRYYLDMNKYPTKLDDLWTKPSDSTAADKWSGPYMEQLKPDPWDNPYQYTAQGKNNPGKYDFWSNGPDGQSGSEDDIGNWQKS